MSVVTDAFIQKSQEINDKFVKGLEKMLERCKTDEEQVAGLHKLWGLRVFYMNQLFECVNTYSDNPYDHAIRIRDIDICFRCFYKKADGECTDCD